MQYVRSFSPAVSAFLTGVPVLMYHKIASAPPQARFKLWYISPRLFASQMRDLKAARFQCAPLASLTAQADNQARQIALTFDDGYRSTTAVALPVLARHGLRGIQFIVAGQIGGHNEWDVPVGEVREPLINETEIREWLSAGNEIGSHSVTHPDFLQTKPEQIRREIFDSKKILEDRFGRPVHDFCYPYGKWTPQIRDLVAEAGYRTACTTESGLNRIGVHPLGLLRLPVHHHRYALIERFRIWRHSRSAGSHASSVKN